MHLDYMRLPGRALFSLGWKRGSLWIGSDHLLMVIRSGYTQEYKRFYYKDIQAIHLRSTSTGRVLGYILGAIAGLSVLLLWLGWARWSWDEILVILWGAVTLFCVMLLAFHLIRGGTCECFLQTAVQLESLVSLKRLRPARKALHILREEIESVQGALDPSRLQAILPDASAYVPPPESSSQQDHEYRGGAHGLLFSVLMLSGFLTLNNIFYPAQWIYAAGYFLFAVLLVLVILSLIRQHSANFPAALKAVTGVSLVYLVLFVSASYFLMILYAIDQPGVSLDYWKLFRTISNQDPTESVPLLILHIFSVMATWGLGITGMFLLLRFRAKPTRPLSAQHLKIP